MHKREFNLATEVRSSLDASSRAFVSTALALAVYIQQEREKHKILKSYIEGQKRRSLQV